MVAILKLNHSEDKIPNFPSELFYETSQMVQGVNLIGTPWLELLIWKLSYSHKKDILVTDWRCKQFDSYLKHCIAQHLHNYRFSSQKSSKSQIYVFFGSNSEIIIAGSFQISNTVVLTETYNIKTTQRLKKVIFFKNRSAE